MASSKRKQDEKHLKMLREMAALSSNKQCLDCHQRGPTYVNMTIGSFVCTSCSGILRGLNPPHRVKSISMASFTPEEMEYLKCHGNEFCRKVYLGLYDARSGSEPDSRDEQKVKDFMIQKYEKKRYYVAPTEMMKTEAKEVNEAAVNKQPTTRPLKTLLGEKPISLCVGQGEQSPKQTLKSQAAAGPGHVVLGQQTQQDNLFQSTGQQSQSSGSATMDLLGDLGGDMFSSIASASSQTPKDGFADFASFNQLGTHQTVLQQPAFKGFQTSNNPLVPVYDIQASCAPIQNGSPSQQSGSDKYSALSDLFVSPSSTVASLPTVTTVNWGGSSSSEINWVRSGSSGGNNIHWNDSDIGKNSTYMPLSSNQEAGWLSKTSTSSASNVFSNENQIPLVGSMSSVSHGIQTVSSNPFGIQGFGHGNQHVNTTQKTGFAHSLGFTLPVTTDNVLGQQRVGFGQQVQSGLFTPASGSGRQNSSFVSGHQQGLGQFTVQNTEFPAPVGFGEQTFFSANGKTMTSQVELEKKNYSGGYAVQQGFSTEQQRGFLHGWPQSEASTNPFMSSAIQQMAPKSTSTNPFL